MSRYVSFALLVIALLVVAAALNEWPTLDFILAVTTYSVASWTFVRWLSTTLDSTEAKTFVRNRFPFFLLAHLAVFLLLSQYFDFDYLSEPGDWHQYDTLAQHYANQFFASGELSLGRYAKASGYVKMVGIVYLLYGHQVVLATIVNIFFINVAAVCVYLLATDLFGDRSGRNAYYIFTMLPLYVVFEMHLLKEAYLVFLFTISIYLIHIGTTRSKTNAFIILIPFTYAIVYVRIIYIIPIILTILFYYTVVSFNKLYVVIIIVTSMIVIYVGSNLSTGSFDSGTIADYAFNNGVSVMDMSDQSFNYQVTLSDPSEIVSVLIRHPDYFAIQFPRKIFASFTGYPIYNIPFLEYSTSRETRSWPLHLMQYVTGVIMWSLLFVALYGLYKMIYTNIKKYAILWIPLMCIPFVNTIVGGNIRYQTGIVFIILLCASYGMSFERVSRYAIPYGIIFGVVIVLYFNQSNLIGQEFVLASLFVAACVAVWPILGHYARHVQWNR